MSEMLLVRLSAILNQTREYTHVRQIAEDRSQYEQFRDRIHPLVTRFHHLDIVRSELEAREVIVGQLDPSGQGVGASITELREAFLQDPASLVDPAPGATQKRRQIINQLELILDSWNSQLRVTWENYIRGKIPNLQPEILEVLARVPTFRQSINTIKRDFEAVLQMAQRLPQNIAELTSAEHSADDISSAWESLTRGEGEVDPEVVEFLKASGRVGAPLRTLTEPVKMWLEEHNLIDAFVVTIRSRNY